MKYLQLQLDEVNKIKLAEWEDIFNSWGWPSDFVVKKPVDWDSIPTYSSDEKIKTKYWLSKPYIDTILSIIGEKESLRYYHIHNLKMNNIQFEIWWVTRKINGFIQKKINENFWFDIYGFMKW